MQIRINVALYVFSKVNFEIQSEIKKVIWVQHFYSYEEQTIEIYKRNGSLLASLPDLFI